MLRQFGAQQPCRIGFGEQLCFEVQSGRQVMEGVAGAGLAIDAAMLPGIHCYATRYFNHVGECAYRIECALHAVLGKSCLSANDPEVVIDGLASQIRRAHKIGGRKIGLRTLYRSALWGLDAAR